VSKSISNAVTVHAVFIVIGVGIVVNCSVVISSPLRTFSGGEDRNNNENGHLLTLSMSNSQALTSASESEDLLARFKRQQEQIGQVSSVSSGASGSTSLTSASSNAISGVIDVPRRFPACPRGQERDPAGNCVYVFRTRVQAPSSGSNNGGSAGNDENTRADTLATSSSNTAGDEG
jgi:hypothetical protein